MFCTKCGEKIEDTWNKCPYCGGDIKQKKPFGKLEFLNALAEHWEKFLATIVILIVVLILIFTFVSKTDAIFIDGVKGGHPIHYPDITYEEAFEQYFSNTEWIYFESDNDRDIVEFNGVYKVDGEKTTMTIRFEVDEDDKTAEIYYMDIEGIPMPDEMIALNIWSIFEEYQED